MNARDRFLAACACRPLDRPPIWIMRQAGRYLPEYRELKARHGFLTLVRSPELAVEASLQPIRRFGFDAAILFSDILVLSEALGVPYSFRDEGGIRIENPVVDRAAIDALAPAEAVPERLRYVAEALALLKRELAGSRALLGFGGSPWTLATYMVEGGSSEDFARIKGLFYEDRPAFDRLLGRLAEALIAYFRMQIDAGADALQIFDSWGGVVAGADYEAASLRWIRQVVEAMPPGFPVIVFGKGTGPHLIDQAFTGARVLSVDAANDLASVRRSLPENVAVQGNLDPVILNTSPAVARRETLRILEAMRNSSGHIFNLGHGILPQGRIDCVEAMVEAVVSWR
jgi:uroporphyrinogen decarboxylase